MTQAYVSSLSSAAGAGQPSPVETSPALVVRNVSAGYSTAPRAVQDVSFSVNTGERVAVLGPNGAGKSTLFKAIVGLIDFNAGEVSIHERDCRTSHALVGYVPQQNQVDWEFPATVRDVVMMGRLRRIGWFRFPGRRDRAAVDAALERVGMTGRAKRGIADLSGGERQRVFVARALAQEADVLLLDEPFSAVDAAAEQEILEVLDRLREQRVTILIATHDLNLASTRFDRVLLIKNHLIAYGTAPEVFTAENFARAYGKQVGVFQDGVFFVVDEH
ncbi:MAG: metal ABC transporter ATP-binding protein [Chloroflexi bacterium]|nr:metal ABC transporter ATP-binding protein [Chloroflexota bacterium]